MADYSMYRTEPAPVSPPRHRMTLSMRDLRAVRTLADMMLQAGYRPRNLRHDRPEVVEALAAEIARRTGDTENDVRRMLATEHGALIHYTGGPQP
jgi:hypothetical protein